MSYLVQHRTQQAAEHAEQQRQPIALSETRRAERLALLERFIEVSAEAERCAYTRPSEWEETDDWYLTTRDVMYRLWVADRLLASSFPCPCMTPPMRTSSTSTGPYGTACPRLRACGTTWRVTGLVVEFGLSPSFCLLTSRELAALTLELSCPR